MHILYLHQYFATPQGKTGTRSYEFARRWVAAGHRVTMLTSTAQLTEADLGEGRPRLIHRTVIDGIHVVALRVGYRQSMGYMRRALSFISFMCLASWLLLTWRGIDVVYATSTPLTIGVPALVSKWFRRRRFVFEVRDVWPAVPVAMGVITSPVVIGAVRFLERTIYRGADAIVAASDGMAELVRSVAPATKHVTTVPNCADTAMFAPSVDGASVRRQYKWGDRCVCLHAGAMGRVNGLDSILLAAEHTRSDSEVLLVLLGEGGEKARLVSECKARGLANLQVLDGVPKQEMPKVLAAADIGLMTVAPIPVLEHNSANKFFDYLSAGMPVLLNYSGWQRDVLESADAGVGCEMGDDERFVANLVVLAGDAARRERMGENARKLALAKFDRDKLAAQALSVLQGVVSPTGTPRHNPRSV